MRKIALVVQRYGDEVNGGAELHARLLVEALYKKYVIEVLTTTAVDYQDWENYYSPGKSELNGVTIHRFKTIISSHKERKKAKKKLFRKSKLIKFFDFFGIASLFQGLLKKAEATNDDVKDWLEKQGPYCPDLISYITEKKEKYDAFIFFTYLYYPTVVGMPIVADKSIFIPTVHDELIAFTKPYKQIFTVPKFIMYNTLQEKKFVERYFAHIKNNDVAGLGFEKQVTDSSIKVSSEYEFDFKYFVYLGRVDAAKGCDTLVEYFKRFAKENDDVKLLLVGKNHLDMQLGTHIISTGFVDEATKNYLLANSIGLIIPSLYESLSMVTLEAMLAGVPVVADQRCSVIMDHLELSQTGQSYIDYGSFAHALHYLLKMDLVERNDWSRKSAIYVQENYSWKAILDKFDKAIDFVVR